MAAEDVRIYEPCDRAIMQMNRENLKAFGTLKLAKWDEVNVIRVVLKVYQESARKARRRYRDVAIEAYVLAMGMCGIAAAQAREMAGRVITSEWVDEVLDRTDFVTMFRFTSETERKAYRLAEALEIPEDRDAEIDKALRLWSRQLGQYAINFTDYAVQQAFDDAGIDLVQWVSQRDNRVCTECHSLDGREFPVDEVPPKPHWGCRCRLRPVRR